VTVHSAKSDMRLEIDALGRLVYFDAQGVIHVGVEPVRAFPLSDPERWIALVDARGHELVEIADLAEMPGGTRELILRELADREFLPRITRVLRVVDDRDPERWSVATDRGNVDFLLRNTDDIRHLGPHRAILVDMHGMRYYVPDSRQLDSNSQRILSRYM
jgi:hypothetical protein